MSRRDVEDAILDLLDESGPYGASGILANMPRFGIKCTAAEVDAALWALNTTSDVFEWGGWWRSTPHVLRSPQLEQFHTVPHVEG